MTHPRWQEFEERLNDLGNGEFKLFGDDRLRQWLRDNARIHINAASRLRIRAQSSGNPKHVNAFYKAVADAEKCLSLLYIMEEREEASAA